MEVFEPEEMFPGTRRSYRKGQAMKRCKEVERHRQGSEKMRYKKIRRENPPGSHILERDDGRRSQGPNMVSKQLAFRHFCQEELAKVGETQAEQAEPGNSMTSFYLKSSSKFLLDEREFYHAFWQKVQATE